MKMTNSYSLTNNFGDYPNNKQIPFSKDLESAERCFLKAIELKHEESNLKLGELYQTHGYFDKASIYYDKWINLQTNKRSDNYKRICNWLAEFAITTKNKDKIGYYYSLFLD